MTMETLTKVLSFFLHVDSLGRSRTSFDNGDYQRLLLKQVFKYSEMIATVAFGFFPLYAQGACRKWILIKWIMRSDVKWKFVGPSNLYNDYDRVVAATQCSPSGKAISHQLMHESPSFQSPYC